MVHDAAAALDRGEDVRQSLSTDQQLTTAECKTGIGRECRTFAAAGRNTLQATMDARTKLGNAKEPVKDSTPGTISAMLGRHVSEQQVQTLQPLLVPISVSFLARFLITVGISEIEHAFGRDGTPRERHRDRWRWLRHPWQRLRVWGRHRKPV